MPPKGLKWCRITGTYVPPNEVITLSPVSQSGKSRKRADTPPARPQQPASSSAEGEAAAIDVLRRSMHFRRAAFLGLSLLGLRRPDQLFLLLGLRRPDQLFLLLGLHRGLSLLGLRRPDQLFLLLLLLFLLLFILLPMTQIT